MSGIRHHLLSWVLPEPEDCGTRNKVERDAWLKRALRDIPAGQRILDAGAGELQYKKFCAHLEYVSQDFAQYDGRGNDSGLQMGSWDQAQLDIVSDITDIPEPDASFDAVLCVEVLEHLPRPVVALKELARLLRPQGILILTSPFCSLTHYAPYFFHTGYSRYFFEYWLPEIGFEIIEIEYNGNYFEYMGQELRRLQLMAQKYAGSSLDWKEKMALRFLLAALKRFSRKDNTSSELLSYGSHVLARRK